MIEVKCNRRCGSIGIPLWLKVIGLEQTDFFISDNNDEDYQMNYIFRVTQHTINQIHIFALFFKEQFVFGGINGRQKKIKTFLKARFRY